MKKNWRGFTLVELMIVIAIITILAAVVIVGYNGIQAKGRDTKRRNDLNNIAEAIQLYRQKYQNDVTSTDPSNGKTCGDNGGNGWLAYTTTSGNESVLNCLQNNGYATGGTYVDPSGCLALSPNISAPGATCDGTSAYMKYTCVSTSAAYGDGNTISFLYTALEQAPSGGNNFTTLSAYSSNCTGTYGDGQTPATNAGMNYVVIVQ